jgi:hypothetical protein
MNKTNENHQLEVRDECIDETPAIPDGRRFDPVISKITKPLKPRGVHAGLIAAIIKGNF